MVKTYELAAALWPVDGRQPEAIEFFARKLREADILPNPGRGRPAYEVTIADAATLLIALHGCEKAAESPEYVRRFRNLELAHSPIPSERFQQWESANGLAVTEELAAAATFGAALQTLIWPLFPFLYQWLEFWGPTAEVAASVTDVPKWQIPLVLPGASIEVELRRLADEPIGATIRICHGEPRHVVDLECRYRIGVSGLGTAQNPYPNTNIDRVLASRFGARTLATAFVKVVEAIEVDNDAP